MAIAPQLASLCHLYGVELAYEDATGVTRHATPECLIPVLKSLGAPVDDGIESALAHRRAELAQRRLPPVSVAWEGRGEITVLVPQAAAGTYRLSAIDESGHPRTVEGTIEDMPVVRHEELDGQPLVTRRMPLPVDLPMGVHTVTLELNGERCRSHLVVAPRRVFMPIESGDRRWGVFMPLYALKRGDGDGVGTFSHLGELIDFTASLGGALVGTLPLLATYLDDPFEPSPYAPVSRLFWNELYLDLTAIPEWEASQEARDVYDDADPQLLALRASTHVDFRAVATLKHRALDAMVRALSRNDNRREVLERALTSDPRLAEYARFRAAVETTRCGWPAWKTPTLPQALGPEHEAAVLRHAYAQMCAREQLQALSARARSRGLGLYLDLTLGVHDAGFDTWAFPQAFLGGCSAGAPPDALFAGGQSWGFSPPHPEGSAADGFAYFRASVKNHMRYAGVLRLDHVMGLHRTYCVPHGRSATEGVYVRQPHEALYAILSLESHRGQTLLLGEDLGTVPAAVRESMQHHGILRMHVQQFAMGTGQAPSLGAPPEHSVASLNTHDTPTLAAFMAGDDITLQRRQKLLTAQEARERKAERKMIRAATTESLTKLGLLEGRGLAKALLKWLGAQSATIVLANLEDLWNERRPHNVPGTCTPENWRLRAKKSLKEMTKNSKVKNILRELNAARAQAETSARTANLARNHHVPTRLGDDDVYLFHEGTHMRLYNRLGAHPGELNGEHGTFFAVWAPTAHYVSVIGDFNGWSPGAHPMSPHGSTGIWETFIPGARVGHLYKYHIASHFHGYTVNKADPVGFRHEMPPATASVITSLDYTWNDGEWMKKRRDAFSRDAPVSIYEVHLGSWMRSLEHNRWLSYEEIGPKLVEHVRRMGFTHVELMPITEHPFYGSWGYQSTGYFAPTARYGSPQDLMGLIDLLHQNDIGVILDWVPSHFPSDSHGLAFFDGTYLYEHADPRLGFHPDWQSCIFNYGRHEVRSFLLSSAAFWLDRYHIDGLRLDAVASMLYRDYSRKEGEWIPNVHGGRENLEAVAFLQELNRALYREYPDIQTIAEESTAWSGVSRPTNLGGLGFGYKWDMGWMHDTLEYMARDPLYRKHHHHELTFRMLYAFSENFVLSLSHDEVVHGKGSLLGKMHGDPWQKFANLRLLYALMWAQPGKKLLFMGQEFAPWREWDHESSLDWHLLNEPAHEGVRRWVQELNHLYRNRPALHQGDNEPSGFEWVDVDNAAMSVIAFMRKGFDASHQMLAVFNFTPVVRHDYRLGVSGGGSWRQIANSDDHLYGGSGVGNPEILTPEEIGWQGRSHSLRLTLPPLGALYLEPTG